MLWQKSRAAQTITVTGPLGVQVAQISQLPGQAATLSRGDAVPLVRAENLNTLLRDALGLTFNAERIIDWVQLLGLPTNGDSVAIQIDGETWQVSAETTQQINGYPVAQRLVARNGDIAIKLFVDDWQNLDGTPK